MCDGGFMAEQWASHECCKRGKHFSVWRMSHSLTNARRTLQKKRQKKGGIATFNVIFFTYTTKVWFKLIVEVQKSWPLVCWFSISHVSTCEVLLCAHTSNRKVTETIFVIKYLLFETLKRCSDYFINYHLLSHHLCFVTILLPPPRSSCFGLSFGLHHLILLHCKLLKVCLKNEYTENKILFPSK